jgi:Sulfatase
VLKLSAIIDGMRHRVATLWTFPGLRQLSPGVLAALVHVIALVIMFRTETILVAKLAFLLAWIFLNCVFAALLRRPTIAALLSLMFIAGLIQVSQFKHSILFMTVVFVDVMVIDRDSIFFLLSILPRFMLAVALGALVAAVLMIVVWRAERRAVRRRLPVLGACASFGILAGLALAVPAERWEVFYNGDYVSKFFRSAIETGAILSRQKILESDARLPDRLPAAAPCQAPVRRPHIILVHDESSFDIRALPGIDVTPGYGAHFKSFDGQSRTLHVESSGGASWFAEYNVLTGLSARSFGSFSYFLTRIAAGRIERGLPRSLAHCGYRTFSFYPSPGGFMGARQFQLSTGIQHFFDHKAMGGAVVEPDAFYYDAALRTIAAEHRNGPLFAFVYLAANHFPWTIKAPENAPTDWRPPGNEAGIDEYLRRQAISAVHYTRFRERLQRDFPSEPILIVRYGDHQPSFAASMLDPALDEAARRRALLHFDPRYFATYFAIDALNFTPPGLSAIPATLDAAYLPLVIQMAAGLPLDPSFREQRSILQRCGGVFYGCRDGAEARRLNRLLIDAGLIKGL